MKRKIESRLVEWKSSKNRKPLLLNGARQVGKTYSILKFAKANYDNVAYIDFSAQKNFSAIFAGDITPTTIIPQLEVLLKQKINPASTLIFFDEIQACDRALTSLKYFCERAPEFHVIAAGSLLGVALNRSDYSFPVGQVDLLSMHPLDFEEYLWAKQETPLADMIHECYDNNQTLGLHEYALDLFRNYLFCGGMPEVLKAETGGATLENIRVIQNTIVNSYIADMTKYASPIDSAKILNVWQGIPEQLAKENHKFQYTTIASSARAHQYEAPINWLKSAGVISLCYRISDAHSPLRAFAQQDFFKIYLLDVGLLVNLYGAEPADLNPADNKAAHFRGGIAENYVIQQLTATGIESFYWGITSKSEVDFIYRDLNGDIIPIEVKTGKNITSRSLEAYKKAFEPKLVMRISAKQFGLHNKIRSVPLYAAFCIA